MSVSKCLVTFEKLNILLPLCHVLPSLRVGFYSIQASRLHLISVYFVRSRHAALKR